MKVFEASRVTAFLAKAERNPMGRKTNKNLLLSCLTVAPEEEEEEDCDQTGVRKSLIFPAAARGLCQRRAEEDGEWGGATEMYYSTSVMTINI